MDIIKFEITEPTAIENAPFKECDVVLFFNDYQVPHHLFNTNEVIAASHFKIAEFDLFTCGCGVPGCAGYQSPVKQIKEDTTVIWKFPKTDDYNTDKKEYCFDSEQFSSAFKALFSQLEELEKDNIFVSSNFDQIGSAIDDEEPEIDEPGHIREGVDWYMNRFQAEEELHLTLKDFNPDLYAKEFFVCYGNETCKFPVELDYLVCSIMNQYPDATKDNAYLAKAILAVQAVEQLINGDNELFKEIVKQGYNNNDLSSFDFLNRYIYSIKEEEFDVNKIKLTSPA